MFPHTAPTLWPRASSSSFAAARSETVFLVKASRPGFYLTAMWFYLLPLGPQLPWHSWAFWLGLFYVGFPLGMLLYAANDISDAHTDRLNPRKDSWLFGARPDAAQIRALPSRIALVQLPFLVAFCAMIGPRALGWFGVATLSTYLYNAPKWGAKDRAGFDVLAQAGYLGVFVLSCWLNERPLAPWPIFVFGALFAAHSHLFGQIMDIAPDGAASRRTTAVTIGAVRSKWGIVALLLVEVALASQIAGKPWLAPALFGAAIGFALDARCLWREKAYPTWIVVAFFVGWNALLAGEIGFSALWWQFRAI